MNDENIQNNAKSPRKEKIRYSVYFRILSIGILLVFMIFMPYLADYYLRQPDITIFQYYEQHSVDPYYDFEAVLINLFLFAILFYTKSLGGAMFAAATPLMMLSYVSSIKYAARNELFRIDDLKLTEAAGMAVHYLDFRFTRAQSIAISTVLFLCVCGYILDRYRIKYPLTIYSRIKRKSALIWLRIVLGSICLVIMVCYGYSFIKSTNNMWELDTYDVLGTGNDRYVLYNFLKNDKYTTITVDNVDASYSYFNSKIQNLETNIDIGQRPTIIAIMNESWWNTDNITNSNIFSSDPMSVYKELAQKCSAGQLSANIFGGGTISSEIEFLTGFNTKYLISDTSVCFELAERKVSSIVDYFHALNYKTTAIHPYQGDFYNRDKIYAMMNFDQVIFGEDMDYTDIYTKFISDESLVKQIIKEYEEGTDAQQFIFAVSIANHLRNLEYTSNAVKEYDYPISVTLDRESFLDESYDDFVNYINGIALANEAFAQLVAYFENVREPVVLVMYGDHCPSFSGEIMDVIGLGGTEFESLKCRYSVPVIMWSNFNDKKTEFMGESIHYLPQMVLEYAGLPESDMTQILRYERSVFKADLRYFVEDAEGNLIKNYNDEQLEAERHFKVLDYDFLFGTSPQRSVLWQPHDTEE